MMHFHVRMRAMVALLLIVSAMPLPVSLSAQQVAARESTVSSRDHVMAKRVSLDVQGVSLETALATLARLARIRVAYESDVVQGWPAVTVRMADVPLGSVFQQVLQGTNLLVEVLTVDAVSVKPVRSVMSEVVQGVIVGKVIHGKTKQPVAGVTVTLGGTTRGVVTGQDGTFRITASPGEHVVQARGIGFVRQTVRISVGEDATVPVEIVLEPSASVLDEVIVTGTVVETQRREIPTAITVLTAADLEKRGITRLEQIFRGEVPGVMQAEMGTSAFATSVQRPGEMQTAYIYARGASSPSNYGAPPPSPLKTYIDGIEMVDSKYLGVIDVNSIDRIEIITGPQASTIYGSGAIGGVMQIFTKKGIGQRAPELNAKIRYGSMQSNVSASLAPVHNESLDIKGGLSNTLTYAITLQHDYSGQWQPNLYNRNAGLSLGLNMVHGALSVGGSLSATIGDHGTSTMSPLSYMLDVTGTTGCREPGGFCGQHNFLSPIVASFNNQVFSLNATHRITPWLSQALTVGQTLTNFNVEPQSPTYTSTSDTLWSYVGNNGKRSSLGYHISTLPQIFKFFSSTISLGGSGSWGQAFSWRGTRRVIEQQFFNNPYLQTSFNDEQWGGFLQWRIGVGNFFTTFGLRAEHSPRYGKTVKLDWRPTNGLSYSFDVGDLTIKMRGAYGKATRVPAADQTLAFIENNPWTDPSQYYSRYGNDSLRAEYSSGPESGVELYYGNVGSLSVNYYRQKVRDLIFSALVDSVFITYLDNGFGYYSSIQQYNNIGDIEQMGWDGTASLNFGPLSFGGTYSWNRARMLKLRGQAWTNWMTGGEFDGVPSHAANVRISYSQNSTSVTVTSNWTGAQRSSWSGFTQFDLETLLRFSLRIPTYTFRGSGNSGERYFRPGYWRHNVVASQRISSDLSVTLNVSNLANSYGSHADFLTPTLGRITQVGFAWRLR